MSARRGWCPDIHAPMLSGDGFLARIKPYLAQFSPKMALAIAHAATRWGNGVIELTARANLQIRGLRAANLADFAAAMIDAGVAEADPRMERARNIMVTPLAGSDPGVHPATHRVAAAILDGLRLHSQWMLPAKAGFVVDGGGTRALHGCTGDLVVRLRPGATAAADAVGYLHYAGENHGSVGLAPAFGQTSSAALQALVDLAALHGDGVLRIGPWRALLVGGVPANRAGALALAAGALGFITDPTDIRLRIAACPGGPICASGVMPARHDAAACAALIGEAIGTGRVHISGCAKGCAHPGPADYTFVGAADGYGIVRHGRASDAPTARGFSLPDAVRTA